MAYDEKRNRRLSTPAYRHDHEVLVPGRIAPNLRVSASLLVLLGFAARLYGQDDSRELLLRVIQNAVDTVERLPKYVCTQTIDRDRYEPDRRRIEPFGRDRTRSCDEISAAVKSAAWKRRLSSSDRLRLDVAVTHNSSGVENEMYSWAGEGGFGDRSLFEVVRDGAVSTGSFASLLASIFGSDSARFSYNGDSTVDGKLLSEFGFRIPEEKSDYLYLFGNGRKQQTTIPYHGTFLVDPKSAELVRLAIRASELPSETGACELSQTLDYGRVILNGADFLLPSETRVSLIHTDETEAENRIRYSACHEFRGEATVRYEPSPAAATSPPSLEHPVRTLALPPRLAFRLAFIEPIDTATAAAGDPIRAKLTTPIRDQSFKILVPEGSTVTGRIVSIRRYYPASRPQTGGAREAPRQYPPLVLAVKLETLEVGGVVHPFKATRDSRVERFAKVTGGLSQQVDLGSLDRLQDRDAAVFDFWDDSPSYVVESGMESSWVTLAP